MLLRLLIAALMLQSVTACGGDQGTTPAPIEELVFPALIGGQVADPKEWQASHFATSGNSGCSGTFVGERVWLSAAHCMANGAKVTINAGPHRYTGRCTHHSEYRGNSTADWAACVIETKVEGIPFEVVNTDPNLVAVGEYVTLTGYGCQKWGGPIDGKLRIGESPVTRLPSGRNYDIVTRGKAALCSGDSGGALYKRYTDGRRLLLSSNSRSDTTVTSYMPMWALPTAQKFLTDWAKQNSVEICGVHPTAKNCRGVLPPLPNKFTIDVGAAKVSGEMKPGFEKYLDYVKAEIVKLLEKLGVQPST